MKGHDIIWPKETGRVERPYCLGPAGHSGCLDVKQGRLLKAPEPEDSMT